MLLVEVQTIDEVHLHLLAFVVHVCEQLLQLGFHLFVHGEEGLLIGSLRLGGLQALPVDEDWQVQVLVKLLDAVAKTRLECLQAFFVVLEEAL